MPLPLYMDVHVPMVVTESTAAEGIGCPHQPGRWTRTDQPDEVLLERASDLGRILFTQDQDFYGMASHGVATTRASIPGSSLCIPARRQPGCPVQRPGTPCDLLHTPRS